jgi:hypothetical protein
MVEEPDQPTFTHVSRDELRPYVRLFMAVVLLFVLQVGLDDSSGAKLAQAVVGSSVLVLAARLGQVSGRWWTVVRVVAVLAVVSAITNVLVGNAEGAAGAVLIINGLVVAAAPVAIVGAVRRHRTITVRTVLAAVTVYVLIGLFFAFAYRSVHEYDQAAFQASIGELTPAALQYLSFVALTTVGFGDVTPVSDLARTLVTLEALIGQVYLVTVVALVVGNLGATRRRRPND